MADSLTLSALPPLEWLRVFESAARRGSFSAAADELGLTQAAVSQRIRKLEARLGRALFVRRARGVELTVDGEAYAPHVHNALTALQRGTADLFSAPRRRLVIAAPQSVIDLWIAPRLAPIVDAHPALELVFATILRRADMDDLKADFEVRFGLGDWQNRIGRKLFDEVLVPVAAPALVSDGNTDWRTLPQISIAGPRDGWREWAAATGVPPPRGATLRFDSLTHGLCAAEAGAGVMLGSRELLEPPLKSGRIAAVDAPPHQMEAGYWLTWAGDRLLDRETSAVIDALMSREQAYNRWV